MNVDTSGPAARFWDRVREAIGASSVRYARDGETVRDDIPGPDGTTQRFFFPAMRDPSVVGVTADDALSLLEERITDDATQAAVQLREKYGPDRISLRIQVWHDPIVDQVNELENGRSCTKHVAAAFWGVGFDAVDEANA